MKYTDEMQDLIGGGKCCYFVLKYWLKMRLRSQQVQSDNRRGEDFFTLAREVAKERLIVV